MNSENYVNMCRKLRVLNAVRDPKVGIPLTITQYPFVIIIIYEKSLIPEILQIHIN